MNIPYQIEGFAFSMIQLLGITVVMSQAQWQVFIVFVPVIAMCIWYQVINSCVLGNSGVIEEYDSPTKLLENKSSSFAQLVAEYSVRSKSSFEN
ncbi:hypothetical protein Ddye_027723 [Dipteronia dyeriana]|uniref:Uncharacterized protein n=1 Tax=Dipteronia dyeriana TaxID=168575 RepID=A0AAD9TQ46_9ROSI|nr:hypothetical protein Ddye_027723 [Dipteronia dyeriana]